MGHFHVAARITGPTSVIETVELLVDTGATLVVLPRALAERLDLRATDTCQVELAGGIEETWPVAEIRIAIEGREAPVLCLIAEAGTPLLGVVALETLRLAVDPVRRRLVTVKALAMPTAQHPATSVPA